jgi:addiction module HigA family antidote
MPMKNPARPGRIVRHDCLEPLGLSVTEGAKALGVTRQALNNVVNGKSGISPEMAIRLFQGFWQQCRNLAADAGRLRSGARTGQPHQSQAIRDRVRRTRRMAQKKAPSKAVKKATAPAEKRAYFKQSDFPLLSLQQARKIASALADNYGNSGSAPPPDVALALDISPTSSGWQVITGLPWHTD